MLEPAKMKDLQSGNGGAKAEQKYVEEWAAYKIWYNSQPDNRVML